MCCSGGKNKPRGFTLIEVLVTIVVIAIAATAILSVFTSTVRRSADPLIQQQAIAIAEAYIEEIMLKDFVDPDGSDLGEGRATFDDVSDYNGINAADIQDQNGIGVAGLEAFDVTVTVSGVTLLQGQSVKRIQVSVNHAAISPIELAAYKANY